MKRIVAVAVLAASFSAFRLPVAAADGVPASHPVLAPIAAFVTTANAGDRAGLIALFTSDAALVDNFAPYHFPAPNGAAHWYDGFVADSAASQSTDGVIAVGKPKYLHVTGSHAWAVMPTTYRYKLKGTPELETGSLVFTLLRTAGGWKLTSMSWAEASDSGLP